MKNEKAKLSAVELFQAGIWRAALRRGGLEGRIKLIRYIESTRKASQPQKNPSKQ